MGIKKASHTKCPNFLIIPVFLLSTSNVACSDNGNGMDCLPSSKASLDFKVAGTTWYRYLTYNIP